MLLAVLDQDGDGIMAVVPVPERERLPSTGTASNPGFNECLHHGQAVLTGAANCTVILARAPRRPRIRRRAARSPGGSVTGWLLLAIVLALARRRRARARSRALTQSVRSRACGGSASRSIILVVVARPLPAARLPGAVPERGAAPAADRAAVADRLHAPVLHAGQHRGDRAAEPRARERAEEDQHRRGEPEPAGRAEGDEPSHAGRAPRLHGGGAGAGRRVPDSANRQMRRQAERMQQQTRGGRPSTGRGGNGGGASGRKRKK